MDMAQEIGESRTSILRGALAEVVDTDIRELGDNAIECRHDDSLS